MISSLTKSGINIFLERSFLSVDEPFHLLEIVCVAGHRERSSVVITELPLRLCEKRGNERMVQIKYRNHKPLPLFSHVNRQRSLRNQRPAAAMIEPRPVAGSSTEQPTEAKKGGVSQGSIRGPEGRNLTNQAMDQPTKPDRCGEQNSDLEKPSPHPDLHHKKILWTWDNEELSFTLVRRWGFVCIFMQQMVICSNPGADSGGKPAGILLVLDTEQKG